jgi:hypothetical protein
MIDNVPNSIGQIGALAMTDTARDPALPDMPRCGTRTPASMRAVKEADMAK